MVRAIFGALLDIFIPPRRSERLLKNVALEELFALQTEKGLPYHDPRVTALVWELKYYANARAAALAGELLAPQVVELAAEEVGTPLLVPVPMHPARLKERGHNQTELLCKAVLAHVPLKYAPNALARVVDTSKQQGLERHRRLQNVKNSMQAEGVEGRVCIVLDDVTTTGATLAEAERALKKAGAGVVHTLALAYS